MLNDALRALAASGPRSASPQVEATLIRAFRRRKRARRIGWAAATGMAAGLAIWLAIPRVPEVAPPNALVARIEVPQVPVPQARPLPRGRLKTGRQVTRLQHADAARQQFLRLPDADAPFEYGAVVRVELPRSALRAVGLPVNEDRFSEPVKADLLIGQDGVARAVRFVQ